MKNPNIRNMVAVICVFVIFYLIANHRSGIFANKLLHGYEKTKSINSLEKHITKLLVLAYPRYENKIFLF